MAELEIEDQIVCSHRKLLQLMMCVRLPKLKVMCTDSITIIIHPCLS